MCVFVALVLFLVVCTGNVICIDATIALLSPLSGMLLPLVIHSHMFYACEH